MKNILIVSSSPAFIERNVNLLRRTDFRIFTAESSAEAMSIIGREVIDLILLDIHLTDMSGELFCQKVCNLASEPRSLILLVCNDSQDDFNRLKGSGADALLARPIKPLRLVKTVGQLLSLQLVRSRRVSLRVKVISKQDAIEFFCISHNISLTGMLIESEIFLELGCLIICRFSIPDSIDVECQGKIVRSSRTIDGGHQYGVQFTSLNGGARHAIDACITSFVRGDISKPI